MQELLILVLKNLSHRKLRTFLTVLGVIIGVAAITGLVSATQSINEMILKEIEKFQTNIIEVVPGNFKLAFSISIFGGTPSMQTLTEKDVRAISSLPGVDVVSASVKSRVIVGVGKEKYSLNAFGIDKNFEKVNTIGILRGRYPRSDNEVLIGYSVAYELFKKNLKLRDKIIIEGKPFKVVGIMKKAGGVFKAVDTSVYLTRDSLRKIKGLNNKYVDDILVKVRDGVDPEYVAKKIEEKLLSLHHVTKDEKDFTVFSPKFSKEITMQVTSLLQTLLGSIAGISLIVGAIGIANMMFTSVLERTREIGIFKAIGATKRKIMLMFLLESGMIGLFGGILGIIAGYGMGEAFLYLRYYLLSKSGIESSGLKIPHVHFSLELSILALIVAFLTGIIAGFLPARKAANLEPVEALRYE